MNPRPLRLSDTRVAALFLVSVCVLAFEIEVMRVFAVASWSNFGSMVISIALLGFGLAGTLLTLLRGRMQKAPDAWLASAAFSLAPSIALAHTIAQQIPFNPVLIASDPRQLWWIALYYLVYGVPFFVGGFFIGAMFSTLSTHSYSLYFWNMLGSGLGGLLVLSFMFLFPPGFLIYPLVGLAVVPALLCCVQWSNTAARFQVRIAETILCIFLGVMSFILVARFGGLHVSDFKPESYARNYPDSALLYDVSSPLGETRVYSSSYFHFAPGLSDNAGVALKRMPKNAFLGMYVDGNGPVGVMRKLATDEEGYIDYLPMSAPYRLLTRPDVLVLRLGGGAGVHTALHHDASHVTVVESNPDLVHMLRDVKYFRDYTGDFLSDRRVKLVNTEVRAFAGSTGERFDLVEIGLIDSIGLSEAGGYSVEENYTYTVQAIKEYLKCLAPGGILSITVWDTLNPPRNVPKLLSTIVQAMRESGIIDPENRIFSFNLLLSTATVLIKNGDFTPAETAKLNAYCKQMSFDANYYPGIPYGTKQFSAILDGYTAIYRNSAGDTNDIALLPTDLYHYSLEWLLAGKQADLYDRYVFNIAPATDDIPYYSGYLKPKNLPSFVAKAGEIPEEWGYLLLLGTFLQSLIFGAIIIVVPVFGRTRKRRGNHCHAAALFYFGCLGLGYMMAEITLIQRFVFYLADPAYANTIVIAVLLVSSGIGSVVSSKIRAPQWLLVAIAAACIAGISAFFIWGLPELLGATLGMSLAIRGLISIAIIAPIGFFLGIPFPNGLAALSSDKSGIIPWAWGINGALSVCGSVLTRLLSTSYGFSTVTMVLVALYLLAAAVFPRISTAQRSAAAP